MNNDSGTQFDSLSPEDRDAAISAELDRLRAEIVDLEEDNKILNEEAMRFRGLLSDERAKVNGLLKEVIALQTRIISTEGDHR